MSTIFRGWISKLGLLTLVMACLIMGMSFRSSRISDVLQLRVTNRTTYRLFSDRSSLVWQSLHDQKRPQNYLRTFAFWQERVWQRGSRRNKRDEKDYANSFSLRLTQNPDNDLPFEYEDLQIRFWKVPHWSVGLPLSLVSVLLLFRRIGRSDEAVLNATPTEGTSHA